MNPPEIGNVKSTTHNYTVEGSGYIDGSEDLRSIPCSLTVL
jgi:hypothetical protein